MSTPIINKEDPDEIYELLELVGTGRQIFIISLNLVTEKFLRQRLSRIIFKARHKVTGAFLAIKVIKLEAGEDLDEVWNEVNFLRDCSHKNIVSYHGCYVKRGITKGQKIIWVIYGRLILQIVMEFCGGGSVEAIIKGRISSESFQRSVDH